MSTAMQNEFPHSVQKRRFSQVGRLNEHGNDCGPDNKQTGSASLESAKSKAEHLTAHRVESGRLDSSSVSSGLTRESEALTTAPVQPLNLPERRRCDNSPCREWFTPTLLRRFHCSWVCEKADLRLD